MYKVPRSAFWSILLGTLLCASFSFAQQPSSSEIQHHRQQIEECGRIISNWQLQAQIQIAFIIAVILFGALITIFQGLNKGWCKPATLALGALTTILTSVNARVFSADYRILQQSVIDGKDLVDQLSAINDDLQRPGADFAGLESQWWKARTQFSGLQKALLQGTSKAAALRIWDITAYAQSAGPSWVNRPPTDDYNLYFIGVAEDRSIEVAQKKSFDDAVADGVKKLSIGSDTNTKELGETIASSSSVDKSYFEFDRSKAVYRYYTLLRISNGIKNQSFEHRLKLRSSSRRFEHIVFVSRASRYTNTGIWVSEGDEIVILARVEPDSSAGHGPVYGPEGRSMRKGEKLPFPGFRPGALIAVLSHQPPFAVDTLTTVISEGDGLLYFEINDWPVGTDAEGRFEVKVVWTTWRW